MISADPHEQILKQWLESHGGILRQLSRAYAPELADADELHQEMRVQLWRSVPRFEGQSKSSTWIYRVCLNTALTWQRGTKRRQARVMSHPAPVAAAASHESNPADRQEAGDLREALMRAVQSLPPGQRSLIVMALDEMPYREIAEVTGMSENHVGVSLTRIRKTLISKMKEIIHEL